MKTILIRIAWTALSTLIVLTHTPALAVAKEETKPNVIVIVADDAGYADFGFQGSTTCETPYIDSIATNGVRFSDAYVTASVCSPSRAGLLTGRYQQRFGHEYNLSNRKLGLPTDEKTVADYMKEAGYGTIALGKWHLGLADKYHPLERGFEDFYGFLGGGRSYWPAKDKSKLIGYQDHSLMLFDLASDPGERTDLANDQPEIVKDLQARFDRWSSQMAKPLWQQGRAYEYLSEQLQATQMRLEHPGHEEPRKTTVKGGVRK